MNNDYLKNIEGFAKQLTSRGLTTTHLNSLSKNPDALVISGMGGSGLAGEILARSASDLGLHVPVFVWKNYDLPDLKNFAFRKPLYCFVSFSGNTEETLSGLDSYLKHRGKIGSVVVITAGGKLKRLAADRKIPCVSFTPGILTPRQATGRMFYSLIEVLLTTRTIRRRPQNFEGLKPQAFRASGLKLARLLRGRVVCIYTDVVHADLGYIWKIRLNETGKALSFNNVIPEMNHNEIVGFERLAQKAAALFLVSPASPRMAKRFHLTEALTRAHGAKTIQLPLSGSSRIEKTWRTLILSDWTAYFLAKMKRVDPGETRIIESLKARMRK